MPARGFRIASSYVEVVGEVNRAQIRRQTEIAGRQAGSAFAQGFGTASRTGMRRQVARLDGPLQASRRQFTAAGARGGSAFADSFTTTAVNGIRRGMNDVDSELSGSRGQFVGGGQRGGSGFAQGVGSGVKGAGLAAVGALAAMAVVGGFRQAMEQESATALLSAQVGRFGPESKRLGKVAGALYADGYGAAIPEVTEAMRGVIQNIEGMGDAGDTELKRITKGAMNTGRVLGEDVGKVSRAVGKMMRTGMAKDAEEAFDILVRGAQTGGNEAEDLLDTYSEYSTQFRSMGLSGEQAMGLISQGLQGGARDADTVADAVKEFSIEAVKGSDKIGDAFEELDLDAGDMFEMIGQGGQEAVKALDITLDELRKVKDPVERNALAVELFGTKAEDLGDALYALDPSSAAQALGQVGGAAKKAGDTMHDTLEQRVTSLKRTIQQAFVGFIESRVLPAMDGFVAGARDCWRLWKSFSPGRRKTRR
jgi:phage-related minor tail protein